MRLATLGCFVIALLCACIHNLTVLDGGWIPWLIGGFVAMSVSGGFADAVAVKNKLGP